VESLRLSPNVPGQNLVDFRVFDSRRPASGPIRAVGLTLRGPAGRNETTSTTQAAPGRWIVPTDVVSAPGRWAIIVRVSRDGRPDAVTDFTWSVGASVGFARRVVSQAQVAPLAGAAGAGLSVTLLALAAAFLAGTRPRARRRVASENIVDGARSPSDESETTGLALTR